MRPGNIICVRLEKWSPAPFVRWDNQRHDIETVFMLIQFQMPPEDDICVCCLISFGREFHHRAMTELQ